MVRTRPAARSARPRGPRVALTLLAAALALAACATPQTLAPGLKSQAAVWGNPHWVAEDGWSLGSTRWGPDDPQVVIVALHGMNDYALAFRKAAEWWAGQGIATYAYDQRGFGRTRGHGVWPGERQMVADLKSFAALVRARHPGVPLYLLGESMGAAVVMAAQGGDAPVAADGVVLVAPAVWGWSTQPALNRTALWLAAHAAPDAAFTAEGVGERPTDNESVLRGLAYDPYFLKRTRADAMYGLVDLMESAWAAAPRIRGRVLVLSGSDERVVPPELIEDTVRRIGTQARLVRYDGGHHMLLRDTRAERAWADVADFTAGRP